MKSLAKNAGNYDFGKKKQSTQDSAAKYWATCHQAGRPFKRADGSVGVDKTKGWHSRPGHKEAIKIANRSITKAARQKLKKQMLNEAERARAEHLPESD